MSGGLRRDDSARARHGEMRRDEIPRPARTALRPVQQVPRKVRGKVRDPDGLRPTGRTGADAKDQARGVSTRMPRSENPDYTLKRIS